MKVCTILVVDDSREIVELIETVLSQRGHTMLHCFNGVQALKLLETAKPDLILLDMNMPQMGGISFFHALVDKTTGKPKYPVIVITGRGEMKTLFDDFEVDGFISKPFELDAMIHKVEEVLEAYYHDT